VTDLVITATIAAGLFSGAAFLAYDAYSTVVWRRQFAPQSQPVQPEPTSDSAVDDLPVPAVDALSP
jgi:hypothetical protein